MQPEENTVRIINTLNSILRTLGFADPRNHVQEVELTTNMLREIQQEMEEVLRDPRRWPTTDDGLRGFILRAALHAVTRTRRRRLTPGEEHAIYAGFDPRYHPMLYRDVRQYFTDQLKRRRTSPEEEQRERRAEDNVEPRPLRSPNVINVIKEITTRQPEPQLRPPHPPSVSGRQTVLGRMFVRIGRSIRDVFSKIQIFLMRHAAKSVFGAYVGAGGGAVLGGVAGSLVGSALLSPLGPPAVALGRVIGGALGGGAGFVAGPSLIGPASTSIVRGWNTVWAPFGGAQYAAHKGIQAGRHALGNFGRDMMTAIAPRIGPALSGAIMSARAGFVGAMSVIGWQFVVVLLVALLFVIFFSIFINQFLLTGSFVQESGGTTSVPARPINLDIGVPDLDAQELIAKIQQQFGLKLEGPFSLQGAQQVYQTMALVGQSERFMSLLHSRDEPIAVRSIQGDRPCGGFKQTQSITEIYHPAGQGGCGSTTVAYTLIHELGHIIESRDIETFIHFRNTRIYTREGPLRTYPLPGNTERESFAEMITDYVVYDKYTFSRLGRTFPEFPTDYPNYYAFARDNIFGGVAF